MPELVMWFCTAAAVVDRAWSMGQEDASYDVLAVAVVSVVLNSLCTSYGAHMNLTSFTSLDADEEEHTPCTINPELYRAAERGGSMHTLVRCLFVHNAAMFLANTSYVVAMLMAGDSSEGEGGHDHGPMSRRVLALLALYVLWYRGSQATFWFHKLNFPHTNVMLPRFDCAPVRMTGRGEELNQYA
jgi:hypothetical protein